MIYHQASSFGHRQHILADHGGSHDRTQEDDHAASACIRPGRVSARASIWKSRKKDIRRVEAHASLDAKAHAGRRG
jgi:hypothetical protein